MKELIDLLLRFIDEHIDLLVWLIPTIHFSLILIFAALLGLARGFRKSLILFIQSLIIGTICFLLFMLFAESEQFDMFLLRVINFFMGGEGSLQNALGVPATDTSLRQVLIHYVPSRFSLAESISLIITDGGEFIIAIVNVLYKVFYGLFFYIIYLIFVFIMYLVYLFAYPQRRYKKKVIQQYYLGETPYQYKKHRRLGLLLGSFRGLIQATITMSFVGVSFFVIAGGDGTRKTEDYDYGRVEYDLVYDSYRAIGGYGKHGIYKFLNNFRDSNGLPLYLFASDIVLSGSYTDDNGKKTVVYLREELQQYVKLSRDVVDLMMKYKSEEISQLMLNNFQGNPTDLILDLFKDKKFCEDLKVIINNFDFGGYIFNFAASIIDTLIDNIDSTSLNIPAEIKDLLMILFKEGYFSNNIPYEVELKSNGSKKALPYLKVNNLLTKQDIIEALGVALNIFNMNLTGELDFNDRQSLIEFIDDMVMKIQRFSIFNGSRKEELDPILMRLYAYVDNVYLSSDKVESFELNYEDENYKNISWSDEIAKLISTVRYTLPLVNDVMNEVDSADFNVLDFILETFNPQNTNYNRNLNIYDAVVSAVGDSKMLGRVLSSAFIRSMIIDGLSQPIGEITIPNNINYANTYDENGKLVSYGEFYNLLTSLRIILTSEEAKELIQDIPNMDTNDVFDTLDGVLGILNSNYKDKKVIDYISSSKFVNLILTSYLQNKGDFGNGVEIYLDPSIITDDGLIEDVELKKLVNLASRLLPTLKPIIESATSGEDINLNDLIEILKKQEVSDGLSSKILEGTISKIFVNNFKDNEIIMIPTEMKNNRGLVSTPTKESEIAILIGIIRDEVLDVTSLINGDFSSSILRDIDDNQTDRLLESNIIKATLSNFLINKSDSLIQDFEIIVPNTVIVGDSITDNELRLLIKNISAFLPEFDDDGNVKEFDASLLLKNILENKEQLFESDTLVATMASAIQKNSINEALGGFLIIPNNLSEIGTKEQLKSAAGVNTWKSELEGLFLALNEMFDLESVESFEDIDFEAQIKDAIPNLNKPSKSDPNKTKIDICYDSDILMSSLSYNLDNALENLVSKSILNDAKDNKGIYKRSEIENLIDVLAMFNIDITNPDNINTEEIVESIKNELLTYNKPNPNNKNNMSNLDILYSSTIFKGVFSTELDKILTDATSGMAIVNTNSTKYLKENNKYYKESEISSIIDLLNVLVDEKEIEEEDGSITKKKVLDFDTLSSDLIKNISRLLDNNLAIENNVSNLYSNNVEYLYQNNALGLIFGNVIAGADATIKVPNGVYDKPIGYLTNDKVLVRKEEVLALLNIIDEFGIDIEDVDPSKIDLAKLKTNKELKDTIANSVIVSALIYNTVKDNNTNIVIPSKVIVDDSKADYIASDELSKLFDGLIYLGITNMDNIDIEKMIQIINDDLESFATTDEIDNIYNSVILRATISGQINNIFIPDMLDEKILSTNCYNNLEKTYSKQEFTNFFYVLYSLNINLEDFLGEDSNQDDLIDNVQTKLMDIIENNNEDEFNKIWSSYIIGAIISKIIDNSVNSLVEVNSLLSSLAIKEDYNNTKFIYKSDEVFNILYNIRHTFNITTLSADSLGNKDWLAQAKSFTTEQVNSLYKSYLMRHIIANSLADNLVTNSLIEKSIMMSEDIIEKYDNENFWWIIKDEFSHTVSVMNDLNIGSDYEVNLDDLRNDTMLDKMYESKIIWGIVSKTLKNQIDDSGSIKHTDMAYEGGVHLYRKSEIKSLLDVIGDNNLDSSLLSTITITTIKNAVVDNTSGTLNPVPKSYLMLNTISDSLLNNASIYISEDDYDNETKMLTTLGFVRLVDGIEALGLSAGGFNNINVSTISLDAVMANADVIFESPSLRLTITGMFNITGNVEIFVYDNPEFIYPNRRVYNKNYSDSYSLTKEELVNLINSFNALGINNFEWEPNANEIIKIAKKDEAIIDTIISSNLVKNIISEFAINGIDVGFYTFNYSYFYDDEIKYEDVRYLDGFNAANIEVLSTEQVRNFLMSIKPYANLIP